MILHPHRAWIFDVDGVLTNPEAKRVIHQEIFDELIKRLRKGEPVGLNTGRSSNFVIDEVLEPLCLRIRDSHLIKNCFTIAEKGAVVITYDEEGKRSSSVDKEALLPFDIRNEIKVLVSQSPFSETMFFDETKQTMVSLELRNNASLSKFKEQQNTIVPVLKSILEKNQATHTLKVDPTSICTDIEHVRAGKALGVRVFNRLLEARGIIPDEYICFGDSASDVEMLTALYKQRKKALLIYVGNRKDIANIANDSIVFTDQSADAGTLYYLQNFKA